MKDVAHAPNDIEMIPNSALHLIHQTPNPPKANVIAIHGVGGDYKLTWTSTSAPSFFWLKDGLSIDLPNHQIWSYGYDSRSDMSFESLSRDLLQLISAERERRQLLSIPMIFLAHGLGGLIIKDALVRSSKSDQFRFVQSNTMAICFFGTPQQRSTATNSARALASLGGRLCEDQSRFSQEVGIITDRFAHFTRQLTIACFYETYPSGKTLILDEVSSTLPDSQNIGLAQNHSELTKYSGRDDPSYQSVLRLLRYVDRSPRAQRPTSPTSPSAVLDTGPSLQFDARVQIFQKDGTLLDRKSTITDSRTDLSFLNPIRGIEDPTLIWMHVGITDSSWVQFCLRSLIFMMHGNGEDEIPILDTRYWSDNERRNGSIPHSRYMEPGCHLAQPGDQDPDGESINPDYQQMAFYMPYLHWDSYSTFENRSKFIENCRGNPRTEISQSLPSATKRLYQAIKDDSCASNSLHHRRSLDQYFYPNLHDTSARDKDQVVSRRTKNMPNGPTMIMVDQLWLWVVKISRDNSTKVAILTCFPEKEEDVVSKNGLQSDADLYRAIMNVLQSDEPNLQLQNIGEISAYVAGVIIERAINKMLSCTNQSLDFLSIFRDAIGQVTDSTMKQYRAFRDALEPERGKPRALSDRCTETRLVLEILDIIDELNSISGLLQTQKDTLILAQSRFEYNSLLNRRIRVVVDKDLDGYLDQVKRMKEAADTTRQSLMDLLDLQQKEGSLDLARLAKEQADETEAQSKILMLFTIVTIVFLPLSFFTSYYGMNVREFTGDEGNTTQPAVWKVMGPISFAIIFILLGYAVMLYMKVGETRGSGSASSAASSSSRRK